MTSRLASFARVYPSSHHKYWGEGSPYVRRVWRWFLTKRIGENVQRKIEEESHAVAAQTGKPPNTIILQHAYFIERLPRCLLDRWRVVLLARIIHDGSSRSVGAARDKRDSRDV